LTACPITRSVWNIELGVVNIHVRPHRSNRLNSSSDFSRSLDSRPRREIEMAQFSVNAQRFDPYKNLKFRVKWDGRYVAGVSKVSGLKRTTEVIEHREGGDPSTSRKSLGRTKFEPITLERGVTHDTEFERWANKVSRPMRSAPPGG
jgi:hypothetical protein